MTWSISCLNFLFDWLRGVTALFYNTPTSKTPSEIPQLEAASCQVQSKNKMQDFSFACSCRTGIMYLRALGQQTVSSLLSGCQDFYLAMFFFPSSYRTCNCSARILERRGIFVWLVLCRTGRLEQSLLSWRFKVYEIFTAPMLHKLFHGYIYQSHREIQFQYLLTYLLRGMPWWHRRRYTGIKQQRRYNA